MSIRHLLAGAAIALSLSSSGSATPPSSTDQQIFYRALKGMANTIVVARADGSNATTLFTSKEPLMFDVGSRSSGELVVGTQNSLRLLTTETQSGLLKVVSDVPLLTGIASRGNPEIAPDGQRIAYRAGDGTSLRVYDRRDDSIVEWASGPWMWDFVWARDGASILIIEQGSPVDMKSRLYEVAGPGQSLQELAMFVRADSVEMSRKDPTLALLSYNSPDGSRALAGTYRLGATAGTPGVFVNPDLTGRAANSKPVFACDDSYMLYGSATKSGNPVHYRRDFATNQDVLLSRLGSGSFPQSFGSC